MTKTVFLNGFSHPEERRKWNYAYARYDYYIEHVWYSYLPCKYKRYLEAMRQFCGQWDDWQLYQSCNTLDIQSHMNFYSCMSTTFHDQTTGRTIDCEENTKIFFLSQTCRFNPAKVSAGHSLAQIHIRPVVGQCVRRGPHGEKVQVGEMLVNSTLRPQGKKRFCPPGQYVGKIPPIQCEICPPDTFADFDTPDDTCEPCPDLRPVTNNASESSSIHCTNGVLDIYRRAARDRLNGDSAKIDHRQLALELNRTLDIHRNLTVNRLTDNEIMSYLAPERSLLNAQFDAERLFQEMTQITFSPNELFSMTMISLGLAVFFSSLTFIIALGSRRGSLAAVDKSIIQKGLSRLWRRVSAVLSANLLRLQMYWRVYRDRRPTWQRRLSAAEATEERNIFKMGSILRQKAEFEHMEELRTRLVDKVIQLSTEAATKADIVRQQELQKQEQLLLEKEARGEHVGFAELPESELFRLGPLEADPLRLPAYKGPSTLKAYLFPPRREIPSFFFFRDNETGATRRETLGVTNEIRGEDVEDGGYYEDGGGYQEA
nr:unnamed protein product [Spirometra erinaceieuropaei]